MKIVLYYILFLLYIVHFPQIVSKRIMYDDLVLVCGEIIPYLHKIVSMSMN
jgi:hypothetical protein